MITTERKSSCSPQTNPSTPNFDMAKLRSHARQLQLDLAAIRAELESMRAKYGPDGEQESTDEAES